MDVTLNAHNHDDFLEQYPLGSFLQGRFWKSFLELQGKKTWQLSAYDGNKLAAHCLMYSTNLMAGKNYLYAPRGPVLLTSLSDSERLEALELILSQIRDITIATRKREEIFCRLESNIAIPYSAANPFTKTEPVQPPTTMYLKLDADRDRLFSTFKEKTRYNIRLAQKKGVTVHWGNDSVALNTFLSLLSKTARRNKIKTHAKKYYTTLLKASESFDAVHINWAEADAKPIAANLYVVQHGVMTYLHGGFDYAYRPLMAPYLLQWDAIQHAMEQGCRFYDFWGYAPSDGSEPRWAGFSRFKEGFSGSIHEYPGCVDYVYNPTWYSLYRYSRVIKKIIRL